MQNRVVGASELEGHLGANLGRAVGRVEDGASQLGGVGAARMSKGCEWGRRTGRRQRQCRRGSAARRRRAT
jgi:hypothetical protein